MEEKIKQKTTECEQCMRGNPPNRKEYGRLQELEKTRRIDKVVAAGLIGPLPSSSGYTTISIVHRCADEKSRACPHERYKGGAGRQGIHGSLDN